MINRKAKSLSAVGIASTKESSRLHFSLFLLVCLTAIAMLSVAGLSDAATSQEPIQAESPTIPFTGLVDIDGETLIDAAGIGEGQWTLVMIWATSCHICKEQKPLISAFHNAHKDIDAKAFGIALDGESRIDAVKNYMDKHDVAFPTYVGDFMNVAGSYQQLTNENLRGTPTYLLFNPSGELKANNPGPISVDALERYIAQHSQ